MQHSRRSEIDAYWGSRLGCDIRTLYAPGTTILCEGCRLFNKISFFRNDNTSIIIIHPYLSELITALTARVPTKGELEMADLFSADNRIALNVSPATEIRYLEPSHFRRAMHGSVRQLTDADEEAFGQFRRLFSTGDRTVAEVYLDDATVMGAFVGRELAACASLVVRDKCVADVSVLTREEYRGRGLAKAAVSAVCEWGLDHNLILQYELTTSNLASRRVAQSLGFELYAIEESALVSVQA
jgi:RimJ/RimL family protein N-acetyltransferase